MLFLREYDVQAGVTGSIWRAINIGYIAYHGYTGNHYVWHMYGLPCMFYP